MSANLASRNPETLISAYEDLTSALLLEDTATRGRSVAIKISTPRHDYSRSFRSRAAGLTYLEIKGAATRKMEASASVVRWFYQGRSSLEELMLQLYFGHLSVSAVDAIMSQIWGRANGAVVLSELSWGITRRLNKWLKRRIEKPYRCVLLHEVNLRFRRSLSGSLTKLVVVAGVNHDNGCDILDIAVVSVNPRQASELLVSKLAEKGLIFPTTIIADSNGTLTAAIRERCASRGVLPFYSEFERELMHGVAFPDRHWASDSLANLKKAPCQTEAKLVGYEILRRLKSSGYPTLSETMGVKLAEHLQYYDHPEICRMDLNKLEKKMGATISQVREQARIIGPVFDDQILVWFTAAAFRRMARGSKSSHTRNRPNC